MRDLWVEEKVYRFYFKNKMFFLKVVLILLEFRNDSIFGVFSLCWDIRGSMRCLLGMFLRSLKGMGGG